MKRETRNKALLSCCALALCFTGLSIRLLHIQVTMHEEYLTKADRSQKLWIKLFANRGHIMDIHGEPMATDEPVRNLVVDATMLTEPERVDQLAALLAAALNQPKAELIKKFTQETTYSEKLKKCTRSPYVTVKKKLSVDAAAQLAAQLAQVKIRKVSLMRGVVFEEAAKRIYPNGRLLCHVLGFLNDRGEGVSGIERSMDSSLCGHNGFREIERTRKGDEIVSARGQELEARNGQNVRLTVDMGLQNIVEQELDATIKQFRPKGATVIMMNPKTGEILALANRPNFDLNEQEGVDEAARLNLAIEAQVEPGSTFKTVTVAAVLDEGLVMPDTFIDCENGFWEWCKLKDHHPYPELSVNDVLVHSSNIGVAKLAMKLGDEKFFNYIHRFGFGDYTGILLPGEIKGVIHPPYTWSKISITRMPMGQEVTATPLQIVTAMSAIANRGLLPMPQIIHDVADEKGKVLRRFEPPPGRSVISPKTADQVRAALMEVASKKGTARLAQVKGYKVAGKTGTSQKQENGHYVHDKHICSFVGFMPADDPAFVMLVLIDEAKTKTDQDVGGLVAAPVFSRIAERAAHYLGLPPSYDEPDGSTVAKGGKTGGDFREQ